MVIGDAIVPAIRVQRIGKRVLLFLFRRGEYRRRLVRLRLRQGQRSGGRLLHNFPNKGDRFRAEDGKADLLDKGDVLKVDNAVRGIYAIHKEGPAVDLKYRFTGNKILCRKFCVGDCWLRGRLDRLLCGKPCCILCDLLHKAAFLLRSIMPVVEQAESTVHIFGKLLLCAPNGAIIAIILRQAVQPGGQRRQHFRSSILIFQLFFNSRDRIIKVRTLWIGTRDIVRRIVKTVIDGSSQLPTLIFRDFGDSILAGESFLCDQALILLDHIGDGQMDGIIFLGIVIPFIVQPFVSLGVSIPGASAAAVLAKAALDEFLVFLRRVGVAEMGIDRQPTFNAFPQKVMVDLILCDKHFALAQEIRLGVKVPLRVGQAVQHNTDPVRVIAADAETHNVRGRGISVKEGMIFLRQRLQTTLCLCERHHILVQFRVALVLVVDRQCLWEKALPAAFFIQVTGRHQKRVHRFVQHLVRGLRQLGRGEISSRLQQLQNASRCLFP